MISTEKNLEDLTLTIKQEIHVLAPLDTTFDALLEQLGPGNETPDGKSLKMKIEAWPGEGGTATWVTTTGISGPMSRPSSGPRCLSSLVRCSRLSRWSRTCNSG